jgi:hypothetical protein
MSDLVPTAGRRARRRVLAATIAAAAALAVTATNLLPGPFDHAAGAQPVPAGTGGVTRYFGRGAYDGIRAAVTATPRSCDLPDDTLAALVMAPIFKEVSQATSPETAPSPMTLSRWDEWSGVRSGSNNMNANYGLYPFWDPATPYPRAYWTPGIGIFQYDSAGVGAPFIAAELMECSTSRATWPGAWPAATAPRAGTTTPAGLRPGSRGAGWAASARARPCSRRCWGWTPRPGRASGWSTASRTAAAWWPAPA